MKDILDKPLIDNKQNYRFKGKVILILFVLIGLSSLMDNSEIPGGRFLVALFIHSLVTYSIFSFFILRGSNLLNNIFSILSVIWVAFIIWGAFFNKGYPYNVYALRNIGIIIVVLAIFQLLIYLRKKNKSQLSEDKS